MKTIVLNQLNNLRASCLFRDIRNANTDSLAETVLKVILILIFFLITSSNLIAQENRTIENTAQVREVTDYLSFQKNAELSSRATYSVAKDVEDLIEKVQPAASTRTPTPRSESCRAGVAFSAS